MAEIDYIRTTLVFVATFAAMYIAFKRFTKKVQTFGPRHLPLAPTLPSLPFVGAMPYLPDFTQFHTFFMDKTATYGKVFSLYIGSTYMVVLNDRDSLEEAFVKRSTEYAGRPDYCHIGNPNRHGIFDRSYHDLFKKYQQLTLNILISFGFGRTSTMETRIQSQVQVAMETLRSYKGHATNPELLMKVGVVNIIGDLLYAKKFDFSDPEAQRLLDIVKCAVHHYMKIMPVRLFPFLRFVPPFRQQLHNFESASGQLKRFMDARIDECLKNDNVEECYVKSFVEHESTASSSFDREELLYMLRDFITAGTETSSVTLLWGIVALANNPEIQHRLHEDIDAVVPADRLPSMDDQPRLPYVEATILELMRWKTLVMLGIPHMTIRDTEVSGYFVPAGSIITSNLYAVHSDPAVFPNPEQFRPERFLDEDGSVVGKKLTAPFSIGKRSCLGQVLAEQEIWLFFTALMQQFDILPPEGQQTVECHEVIGTTTEPSAFEVRFVPRKTASN